MKIINDGKNERKKNDFKAEKANFWTLYEKENFYVSIWKLLKLLEIHHLINQEILFIKSGKRIS